MKLFKFLKWFFKNRKTQSISHLLIMAFILGSGIYMDLNVETQNMWVFYSVVPLFFIGYYLVQYRAYLRMEEIEKLKNK